MRPQAPRPPLRRRDLRSPSMAPLPRAVSRELHGKGRQKGFNLVELMLVAGVIAASTAVVYTIYQNVNAAAKTQDEGRNLQRLARNVLDSYGGSYDFSGLTTESALNDGLFPPSMLQSGATQPRSSWGSSVRVLPTSVVRNGVSLPDWGFVVAYDNVPAKACVDLVSEGGAAFHDVRVEGTSVGVGRTLDVQGLGDLCDREGGADIQFIYQKPSARPPQGALTLCESSLPAGPETQVAACPAGQYGLVHQTRSAFCTDPYAAFEWTPWSTTSQTCVSCPSPQTRTVSKNVACPTGQLGIWTQERTEQRTANCPLAGPNGPTELTAWNAWVATSSWATTVNTCTPICVLPTPSTQTRWVGESLACPPGQYGHNGWESEERRTATCPAPTGAYTWSGWAQTGNTRYASNTCTTCPGPDTRQLSCPTGQYGAINQSRSFVCAGEGSWGAWTTTSNTCATCPAPETRTPTCPAGTVGVWTQTRSFVCSGEGSWGAWTTSSNTCTACPGPETRTVSCPAGQWGSRDQQRTYNCTGSGSWNAWATTTNNCTACPAPTTETSTNWAPYSDNACPVGSYGFTNREQEQTRSRTVSYTCPSGSLSLPAPTYGAWSPWSNTGNTRYISSACTTCPAATTETQTQWGTAYQSANCPAGQFGSSTLENEQKRSRTKSYDCPAGTTALPPASYTSWSAWANTGTTRQTDTSCENCPAPFGQTDTQWVPYSAANCAAGQYGTTDREREQSRSRTGSYTCPAGTATLPAPAFTPWSAWTNTGATRFVSSSCITCPAPAGETDTQWVAYTSINCPAGQYGFTNREREQSRTRTRSYVCPAGSASLPPASYTPWSAWANTGATRQISAVCTNCPAPATETDTQWVAYTASACPAGQYGFTNREREQERTRTKSYNCPAGTSALPAPDYTAWGAWTNTGATRHVSAECTTCPAPSTETQTQWALPYALNDCPAGQHGFRSYDREQERTRTKSYNCPAGTSSLPSPSYTAWSAWANTGTTRQVSSSCETCPAPATETDTQWVAYTSVNCPAGYHGYSNREREQERTRTRSYSCPAGTSVLPPPSYTAWSAWANTGATRHVSAVCTACPAPFGQAETQWAANYTAYNCPAGQYGYTTRQREQERTRTGSYSCPAGTANLPAPTYTAWSAWANTGATRQYSESCNNCPAPATETDTQWVAYTSVNCPAGQYGHTNREREQARTRTRSYNCPAGTSTLPAPSYTAWGAWANTGTTRYVSSVCTTCPAPATETQTQWASPYNTNNCPAGTYGYRTYEREQERTRTKSYNCPAGTSSLPSPSYTAWSAWANTGTVRLASSTCPTCPAPSTDTQTDWEARSAACPSGQVGSRTWEELRQRSRSKSYNCPAGTASLPAPTYGAYGAWSWTGQRRNEVNTCTPAAPCAGGAGVSWSFSGYSCSGLVPAGTHAHGAQVNVNARPVKFWDGNARFTCSNGTWVYNNDGFCSPAL